MPEEIFVEALESQLERPNLFSRGAATLLHKLQHQRLPTLRAWLGEAFGLPPLRRIVNLADPAALQVVYLKKQREGGGVLYLSPLGELRAAFAKAIGNPNHFATE